MSILFVALIMWISVASAVPACAALLEGQAPSSALPTQCSADPAAIFTRGEAALRANELSEAEKDFRGVLVCDPKSGAAYSNLGVIAMRRQQWPQAISMLTKAKRLAPQISGIRLNLGVAHFRQGNYVRAIPELRSVASEQDSVQAKYLLGLSYFLTQQYSSASSALAGIWKQQSNDLLYLYVLGIAAMNAKEGDLEQKAMTRFAEIGSDSPEFHLLKGKAYLNRDQPEPAIQELETAIRLSPRLPFAHFNLGWAYMRHHEYDRARSELLTDISIEPDVPYSYEQLGVLSLFLHEYVEAEHYYKEALARDARLPNSLFGLGKIEEQRGDNAAALRHWRMAAGLAPDSISLHYVIARALRKLGRTEEAAREFARIKQLETKKTADELATPQLPNPELRSTP